MDQKIFSREEKIGAQRKQTAVVMKKLQKAKGDYSSIHQELKTKRLKWWEKNKDKLQLKGSLPRQAYELFLLKAEIDSKEAPVVHEDKKKIIWHSFNFCPVLEACKKLGLDTRKVCREAYEESVQDLIACLDSRLKFSRNYDKIRPYAEYCEEMIELGEK